MQQWPDTLSRLAVMVMACPDPRAIFWGDYTLVPINQAAAPILGKNLGGTLQNPLVDLWAEQVRETNVLMLRQVVQGHGSTKAYNLEYIFDRSGFTEEAYLDIDFLPESGRDGHCAAMVVEFTDVTVSVMHKRRRKLTTNMLA